MPPKNTPKRQTHYYNDGCGEPEHNDPKSVEEIENLERVTERGMWWVRLDRVRDILTQTLQAERQKQEQIRKEAVEGERERNRQLLLEADSKLSLLASRGSIQWGKNGLPEKYEIDHVIGKLRKAYER